MTSSDFAEVTNHLASGTRILMRRGEVFTVTKPYGVGLNVAGPVTIGAFGQGAAPVVRRVDPGTILEISSGTPLIDDWRIMDLALDGNDTTGGAIFAKGMTRRLLFLRLDFRKAETAFDAHPSILNWLNNNGSPGHDFHEELAIVDSVSTSGQTVSKAVAICGRQLALMGNRVVQSGSQNSAVVMYFADRAVISHNAMDASTGSLLVTAQEWSGSKLGAGEHSRHIVVSDNRLSGMTTFHPSTLVVGPINSADGRIRQMLVERNHFQHGSAARHHFSLAATDVTVRNNIFDSSAGEGAPCIQLPAKGSTDRIRIEHNTAFTATHTTFTLVNLTTVVPSIEVTNNLIWAPQGATTTVLDDNGTARDGTSNLVSSASCFLVGNPTEPEDFGLRTGSPAIDIGSRATTLFDFAHTPRPVDGDSSGTAEPDVGAFEYLPGGG